MVLRIFESVDSSYGSSNGSGSSSSSNRRTDTDEESTDSGVCGIVLLFRLSAGCRDCQDDYQDDLSDTAVPLQA